MSADYISTELRQLVIIRANQCCEYCLVPESYALHRHETDHIIPRQHGGETTANNLALACLRCNRYKGPNVGSFDPLTGKLVPFFNPRLQKWTDHFQLEQAIIHPLTPEGRVTVHILRLNDHRRLLEREQMILKNSYPPNLAQRF